MHPLEVLFSPVDPTHTISSARLFVKGEKKKPERLTETSRLTSSASGPVLGAAIVLTGVMTV
jgi:hypothetical protein